MSSGQPVDGVGTSLLVLVAATALVLWFAASEIEPSYDAKASLVLIPPRTPDDPDANRYLDLGSLSNSVDVLSRSMISEDTAELLEEAAPGATYDVSHDLTTSAPIVLVSVTSGDEASAALMLDAVLAQIPRNLESLQAEIAVKPQFRITALVVSQDSQPIANQKTRTRLLGVLGAALLFGSAVLIAVTDGLLLRRSHRKERAAEEPGESGGSDDPDPESDRLRRQTVTVVPTAEPRRRDVDVGSRPPPASEKAARAGRPPRKPAAGRPAAPAASPSVVTSVSQRVEVSSSRGARSSGWHHLDAVSLLTVYLVLLFGVESRLVIQGLGAAGSPALLVGCAGFGWWTFYQAQRPAPTGFGRQPVRTRPASRPVCVPGQLSQRP